MILKYVSVITRSIEEETLLFLDLGFKCINEIMLWENVKCRFMALNDDSFNIILIPERPDLVGKRVIFLSTNNCLQDYLQMKSTGVKFCADPYYAPGGLFVEFEDTSGNRFVLLEERVYEEIY